MSRITLAEKEHWRSRIESRIRKSIEELEASDPVSMTALKSQALDDAHTYLGVRRELQQISEIESEELKLEMKRKAIKLEMYRRVFNEPDLIEPLYYNHHDRFKSIVESTRSRFEEKLLSQSELGKKILALKAESDTLLDTVWLATSSSQIKDLWTRVIMILDGELSPLQKQLLSSSVSNDTP